MMLQPCNVPLELPHLEFAPLDLVFLLLQL